MLRYVPLKTESSDVVSSNSTSANNSTIVKEHAAINECNSSSSGTKTSGGKMTLETVPVRCRLCGSKLKGTTEFLQHFFTYHKDADINPRPFHYAVVDYESFDMPNKVSLSEEENLGQIKSVFP